MKQKFLKEQEQVLDQQQEQDQEQVLDQQQKQSIVIKLINKIGVGQITQLSLNLLIR